MRFPKRVWHFATHRKKIVIPAIVAFVILVLIFRPKPAPPIATQAIKYSNLVQSLSVAGNVIAKSSINLTFPISGTVNYVGVKKGDTVVAGQVIATLDARTTLKNLQNALISYSEQRNSFDQTIQSNNGIQKPSDALNDTMKRLLQNNQYDLDKTINSVELQDIARQQSVLTSPIGGIVTRLDMQVAGSTALAGSTTFTVTDPTSISFDMDVDQADIARVSDGENVKVIFDAYPDKTVQLPVSSIDFVSHTTTNGGNAYTVEINLPVNKSMLYRVGMSGNADIITGGKDHVLTVPIASLFNDTYVYVKTTKGFEKRKVTLGLQSDTDAEVISGLQDNDVIALDPTSITKK